MKRNKGDSPEGIWALLVVGMVLAMTPALRAQTTGTVKGKVGFTGTPPVMIDLKKTADPVCAKTPAEKDEQVVVNPNGTLKNVVVRVVKGASAGTPPATAAELDQLNCGYRPRVLAVMAGQKVMIKNSDPILHNVHSYQNTSTVFNQAMMPKAPKPIEKTFTAGVTKFKCDVHPWMSAWVVANDNPYFAVTGADGTFALANLPAGTYTLEAWHEKYGAKTQEVTLAAGQAADVTFNFAAQ